MSEVIAIKKKPAEKLFILLCRHKPAESYPTLEKAIENMQTCCCCYVYSLDGEWKDGEAQAGKGGPNDRTD